MHKFRNINLRAPALAAASAGIILMTGLGMVPSFSYLTDTAPYMKNPFTIALNTHTEIHEDFPEPVPDPNSPKVQYKKTVNIENTGYIDAYVRVSLDFSDSTVEQYTQFSPDGSNYYSVSDYRNHLPSGWTYADGYYYCRIPAKTDKTGPNPSKMLINSVRTTWPSMSQMVSYNLNVSCESYPTYLDESNPVNAFVQYQEQTQKSIK